MRLFPKRNKKVGLALGGGVALGAAHIGVLRAISELGIMIDYVAGTSVGAFIAAFHAFKKDWQEIEKIALQIEWKEIAGFSVSKFGLLSNKKMENLIVENIGDVNFDDSAIPLAMIATDITTGNKVVLDKGSVSKAIMASTCIPGIFMPVEINDKLLVDGGIVENVPISPLKNMGADIIIGVDLNANYTYDRPENMVDVLMNSFHFTLQAAAKLQTEKADILIRPDLSAYSRTNLKQAAELIDQGYFEAKKALKESNLVQALLQ